MIRLLLTLLLVAACGAPTTPAPSTTTIERLPTAVLTPTPLRPLALVAGFNTRTTSVRADELVAISRGDPDAPFGALLTVADEAALIAAALGVEPLRLRTLPDHAALRRALLDDRTLLGVIDAGRLEPALSEIGFEELRLTGVTRLREIADWPLRAALPARSDAYDPATAWTAVFGGDILIDRGVAYRIRQADGNVDYPFAGGYARVTGTRCCGLFGDPVSTTRRAGGAGAVRALLSGADVAIANLESPTPRAWRYHNEGTRFTGDPALVAGIANAGIDWLSLANNHIGDGGRAGILETIATLEAAAIAHGGAGATLAEAQRPSLIEVGGITLAIIAVDAVAPGYHAQADRPGSAPLTEAAVAAAITDARASGADLVVLFPHWGVEFQAEPTAAQRRLARAAIDAGADLIVGGHSHWASAIEVIDGRPVFYGVGNFVFDQNWSVETAQGILIEATFAGARLVSLRLHPTEILEQAQPNLLVGDGFEQVLRRIERGSAGLAGW